MIYFVLSIKAQLTHFSCFCTPYFLNLDCNFFFKGGVEGVLTS